MTQERGDTQDHLPWPPVIAEARSPFTAVRVAALLLARSRGFGERVAAVADALNAAHTDWLFETRVVSDELLQLQSNWFSDFRTTTGFALSDSPNGTLLHLEDSLLSREAALRTGGTGHRTYNPGSQSHHRGYSKHELSSAGPQSSQHPRYQALARS